MKTYTQQILEHLHFLRSHNFCTQVLKVDKQIHRATRGSYVSHAKRLSDGSVQIMTLCCAKGGTQQEHKTDGAAPTEEEKAFFRTPDPKEVGRLLREYNPQAKRPPWRSRQ